MASPNNHATAGAPSIYAPLSATTFAPPTAAAYDSDLEESADGAGYLNPPEQAVVYVSENSFAAKATPEERTAALLEAIAPQRFTMLAVLDFCRTAQPVNAVLALARARQAHNRSVFAPDVLFQRLEEAGALKRVDAAGNPYQPQACEPTESEVEGRAVLQVAEAPQAFLVTTEAGAAALAAHDSAREAAALFDEYPAYLPLYRFVLEAAGAPEGASTEALRAAIDPHPLTQKPRLFASAFIEQLERIGAVAWTGSWTITAAGREALALLAERGVEPLAAA